MLKKSFLQSLFAFVISLILVFALFGDILKSPNYILFAKGGDGLKSTFGSYYHLVYDSSYNYTGAMNYPYGESVYFTGGQPVIVNSLKFLENFGFDFSNNLTGILNVWLLFSLSLGNLFLFILLRRLKLPVWYSIIAANIIILLSPQIDRIDCHFNLAYLYFIPLFLLLLHLFRTKPRYIISVAISVLSLIALASQAYFFAFYLFIVTFFYVYMWWVEKNRFPLVKTIIPHFLIQIILPFIVFNLIAGDNVSDRTSYPWGFFHTRASFESVFLPLGKPYGKLFGFIRAKWEGMAYVGLASTITVIVWIYNYIRRLFLSKFRAFNEPITQNNYLNALLLGAIIALFFSFGYPFLIHLKRLLNYTGPIRQFRAIGRFSWIFYYTLNITVFYTLWLLMKNSKRYFIKIIFVLALIWGSYDAWINIREIPGKINNYSDLLSDIDNKSAENHWVDSINIKHYQAIMPIPYYHVGSETYWIDGNDKSEKYSFIGSMKTGLPLNSVMLSRTSISESIKNIALIFEPLDKFEVLSDYDNNDILLMVAKGSDIKKDEKRLINYSKFLIENDSIKLYSLSIDSIKKIEKDYRIKLYKKVKSVVNEKRKLYISDSLAQFIHISETSNEPHYILNSNNKNNLLARKSHVILDTTLSTVKDFTFSFWMSEMNKDLIPRTMIDFRYREESGKIKRGLFSEAFRKVKYLDKSGWALVEFNFKPYFAGQHVQLILTNELTTSQKYSVDNIMVYPKGIDVAYIDNDYFMINNRYLRITQNLE